MPFPVLALGSGELSSFSGTEGCWIEVVGLEDDVEGVEVVDVVVGRDLVFSGTSGAVVGVDLEDDLDSGSSVGFSDV